MKSTTNALTSILSDLLSAKSPRFSVEIMEEPGFLTSLIVVSKLMKPMDSADWAAKQRLKAPAHQLSLKTLEPVMKTYSGISACCNCAT
jgi:hypothetical protein